MAAVPQPCRPCRCPDCGALFQTDDLLMRHREKHVPPDGDALRICPECRLAFEKEEEWRAHRALHTVLTR